MAKTILSVSKLIDALFPRSSKTISEKLTTPEFNAFAEDVQTINQAEPAVVSITQDTPPAPIDDTDTTVEPGQSETTTTSETETTVSAEAPALEPTDPSVAAVSEASTQATDTITQQSDLAAQVDSLTQQLNEANLATAAEAAKVTSLQAQVNTLTAKLTEKDAYITQLKGSVNPLAEADASTTANADQEVLTVTDREARKRRKK